MRCRRRGPRPRQEIVGAAASCHRSLVVFTEQLLGEINILAFHPAALEKTMTQAFVYDAIRTPRGKGKKDGSLHEVKPVNLLAGVLGELQRRNGFDTAMVDDVVMGVVSPIGEQGSVIA